MKKHLGSTPEFPSDGQFYLANRLVETEARNSYLTQIRLRISKEVLENFNRKDS